MDLHQAPRQPRPGTVLLVGAFTTLLVISCTWAQGQQAKVEVLRIGSSGSLTTEKSAKQEKSAVETLRTFIKEETGLENEIVDQKDWIELVNKMAKGKLHLGVFQGYEFAWAQENHPGLKPLALAVNVYRYPVAYVVTKRAGMAKKFADLQGKTLSIPTTSPRFLRMFLQHECQLAGKNLDQFFSKITSPENIEDALDDVVDGITQATVVDRAALEAFKQRKLARFKKLIEVAHSQPIPPPVIAYYNNFLDDVTRTKFQMGLLGAHKKEKGETMLTLFHLTGFELPPSDFGKVLAQTRKTYLPPTKGK